MAPIPLDEHATGIFSLSASATIFAAAPAYFTPWPTRITGRSAEESICRGLFHPLRVRPAARGNVRVPLRSLRHLHLGFFLEDVERNVEHDGSAPARHHRLPRLARELRHHLRPRGLVHPLAVGLHGGGEIRLVVAISLLKRPPVELVGGYVARHGQKRNRIEKGVGQRYRHVGRARPAGGERRHRLARHPVIDIGHEAAQRLVSNRERLDFIGAFMERIQKTDVPVAAKAEHIGNLFLNEIIDDNLATIHVGQNKAPSGKNRGNNQGRITRENAHWRCRIKLKIDEKTRISQPTSLAARSPEFRALPASFSYGPWRQHREAEWVFASRLRAYP